MLHHFNFNVILFLFKTQLGDGCSSVVFRKLWWESLIAWIELTFLRNIIINSVFSSAEESKVILRIIEMAIVLTTWKSNVIQGRN